MLSFDAGGAARRSLQSLGAGYAYAFVSPRRVLASRRLHAVWGLFSSTYPGATCAAILIFVVLWLVISTSTLWVGIAKAGCST